MKKLLVLLFIMLGVISFSKNLNDYESKRIFDKLMKTILYGDYEKYRYEPEMYRILELDATKEEINEDINSFTELQLNKDFYYKVLDVKENGNESILTIKVQYKIITDTKENVEKEYSKAIKKLGAYTKDDDIEYIMQKNYENVYLAYALARENLKFKILEKNIDIYLVKENGLWYMPKEERREEFILLLNSGVKSYYKIFSGEEENYMIEN